MKFMSDLLYFFPMKISEIGFILYVQHISIQMRSLLMFRSPWYPVAAILREKTRIWSYGINMGRDFTKPIGLE